MVRVKICGITNLEDAQAAIKAGADALGFVFYKNSPRYISPARAKEIIKQLPLRVKKVGVFVDTKEKLIKDIAKIACLDILQLHGSESARFCARFKRAKLIKAFKVNKKIDLVKILKYKVFAYLFDAYSRSKPGGTGRIFDWRLLGGIKGIKRPVFLSGGLNEANVRQAIRFAHPDWVDVSGSLELGPGKKDYAKVKKFIAAAKGKQEKTDVTG